MLVSLLEIIMTLIAPDTATNYLCLLLTPALANAPADLQCKTPGCLRPRRMMDDGSGYYDFCSLTCRDQGASGMVRLCSLRVKKWIYLLSSCNLGVALLYSRLPGTV